MGIPLTIIISASHHKGGCFSEDVLVNVSHTFLVVNKRCNGTTQWTHGLYHGSNWKIYKKFEKFQNEMF